MKDLSNYSKISVIILVFITLTASILLFVKFKPDVLYAEKIKALLLQKKINFETMNFETINQEQPVYFTVDYLIVLSNMSTIPQILVTYEFDESTLVQKVIEVNPADKTWEKNYNNDVQTDLPLLIKDNDFTFLLIRLEYLLETNVHDLLKKKFDHNAEISPAIIKEYLSENNVDFWENNNLKQIVTLYFLTINNEEDQIELQLK